MLATQKGTASLNEMVQMVAMSARMHSFFRAETQAHNKQMLEAWFLSHAVPNFRNRRLSMNGGNIPLISIDGLSPELQSICRSREMEKHLLQNPYVCSRSSIIAFARFKISYLDLSCKTKRYILATRMEVVRRDFANCVTLVGMGAIASRQKPAAEKISKPRKKLMREDGLSRCLWS